MKLTKILVSLCLVLVLAASVFTVYTNSNSETITLAFPIATNNVNNLLLSIEKDDISPIEIADDEQDKTDEIMSFSFDVLSNSNLEENILISPLSIISALGMTANAADGETLSQMQDVFGADIKSLNEFLYSYMANLPNADAYQVNLANSKSRIYV